MWSRQGRVLGCLPGCWSCTAFWSVFALINFLEMNLWPQNCLATRQLARLTSGFVFVNLGATISTCFLSRFGRKNLSKRASLQLRSSSSLRRLLGAKCTVPPTSLVVRASSTRLVAGITGSHSCLGCSVSNGRCVLVCPVSWLSSVVESYQEGHALTSPVLQMTVSNWLL